MVGVLWWLTMNAKQSKINLVFGRSFKNIPQSVKIQQLNKHHSLRVIGISYRGDWICIAGSWHLQTTSFETPSFLGHRINNTSWGDLFSSKFIYQGDIPEINAQHLFDLAYKMGRLSRSLSMEWHWGPKKDRLMGFTGGYFIPISKGSYNKALFANWFSKAHFVRCGWCVCIDWVLAPNLHSRPWLLIFDQRRLKNYISLIRSHCPESPATSHRVVFLWASKRDKSARPRQCPRKTQHRRNINRGEIDDLGRRDIKQEASAKATLTLLPGVSPLPSQTIP